MKILRHFKITLCWLYIDKMCITYIKVLIQLLVRFLTKMKVTTSPYFNALFSLIVYCCLRTAQQEGLRTNPLIHSVWGLHVHCTLDMFIVVFNITCVLLQCVHLTNIGCHKRRPRKTC